MSLLDAAQSRFPSPPPFLGGIKTAYWILFAILLLASFTRFWRLTTPDQCYFDEVYFPTTAAEILRGDNNAWAFYGHENTHPPLSKEIMALGMGIFGHRSASAADSGCWGDQDDEAKRTDPDWLYKPVGWRFFGALAGVGSVLFMYLLSKRLFQSEVAALASAAFLTFDGLALAQSRIATPDTYVLFFLLGTLYFLVSDRFLLSGVFYGAAAACKWIGAFAMAPIVLYLIVRLLRGIQETEPDERMKPVERVLQAAAVFFGIAAVAGVLGAFLGGGFADGGKAAAVPGAVAVAIVVFSLARIVVSRELRSTARGRLYVEMVLVLPVFFLIVPGYIYLLTYVPMLLNGHATGFLGLGDVWELNKQAYEFHSSLTATHGYSSTWSEWPILSRPIYLYVDSTGGAKIYSMGNPVIFWLGMPAIAFILLQGLNLRTRLHSLSGSMTLSGGLSMARWPLLFVFLSYLGLWLPWATQPRTLFLYHYLPALIFVILALGYCVERLWHHEDQWGRTAAIAVLALAAITFAYFYPHWTAINVSQALDESYYWFKSWR